MPSLQLRRLLFDDLPNAEDAGKAAGAQKSNNSSFTSSAWLTLGIAVTAKSELRQTSARIFEINECDFLID
jgi:hypothetical protein